MITLHYSHIKAVKCDLVKRTLTVTVECGLGEQERVAGDQLANYAEGERTIASSFELKQYQTKLPLDEADRKADSAPEPEEPPAETEEPDESVIEMPPPAEEPEIVVIPQLCAPSESFEPLNVAIEEAEYEISS